MAGQTQVLPLRAGVAFGSNTTQNQQQESLTPVPDPLKSVQIPLARRLHPELAPTRNPESEPWNEVRAF